MSNFYLNDEQIEEAFHDYLEEFYDNHRDIEVCGEEYSVPLIFKTVDRDRYDKERDEFCDDKVANGDWGYDEDRGQFYFIA